eukprot:361074-Chlamydomonas_euryale.AAC.3
MPPLSAGAQTASMSALPAGSATLRPALPGQRRCRHSPSPSCRPRGRTPRRGPVQGGSVDPRVAQRLSGGVTCRGSAAVLQMCTATVV